MANPIRERFRANHPIAAAVVAGVAEAARQPGNALRPQDAPAAAAAVQDAIARDPVAQNALNTEPWWQSRIYIGLLFTALTMVLRWFGVDVEVSTADQATIMQILPVLGLAVATIGRGVKGLAPVDWRRPWTLFGLGRDRRAV